ncbi:DUF3304 domain-containing protein [Cystobacter fuscus]
MLLLGLCLGVSACKKEPEKPPLVTENEGKSDEIESMPLTIHGANYTDLYIEDFSVDSVGGGNIFVSSPDSGGGKSACCLRWFPGVRLPFPVEIEWTRDRKRWCKRK